MRNLILVLSLLTMPLLFVCPDLFGQVHESPSITIQKVDFRGKRPQSAVVAATSASKNDVVVILLRGADQELIDETEGNIKGLIRNGYSRVGLILCDPLPDESKPIIAIFSRGYVYARIEGARSNANTSLDLNNFVRDAYKELTALEE